MRRSNQQLDALCQSQKTRLEIAEASNAKMQRELDEAQQELAVVDRAFGTQDRQLREAAAVLGDLKATGLGGNGMQNPSTIRLRDFCAKAPCLDFDPNTGLAKSTADLIFETGRTELKPAGMAKLRDLVDHLRLPEARDFRVMVVGHTDDRRVAGGPPGERFRDNFQLSTERANAVVAAMRDIGLPGERIGIAGFGPYQPVAPNVSLADREKNRRVEVFVIPSQTQVVGWTDTIPTAYR